MGNIAWCKMLLKAMFQWNVLLKSSFVAALVGTVLTYTNYGTYCLLITVRLCRGQLRTADTEYHSVGDFWNNTTWPVWWKLILNYAVPFVAEAFLCVFLNTCRHGEVTEVILHEIKQDQHTMSTLPEVAVYSGLMKHGKGDALPTIDGEAEFSDYDHTLSSRYTWPSYSADSSSYYQPYHVGSTKGDAFGMYTVKELMGVETSCGNNSGPFHIRPLPKESARKALRARSMGCVSDLYGRQRIRTANAERLHVFNNGLYAGDSPPPPSKKSSPLQ